jgi:thiamine kinase-like enzyme
LSELHDFLQSIGFPIDDEAPQPLRGLSNRNYLVRSGGADYVVRLAGTGASHFGIDREAEAQALELAFVAGLGAEVVHYALPEGHLVTRAIPAEEIGQSPERYREPKSLRRITRAVKRIHELPPIEHRFDPIDRIRVAFRRAAGHDTPLPAGCERVFARLDEVERRRGELLPAHTALCHNDLFAGNILDSDPVRIVDWEFAGMGDIFFDLATLAVACDEVDPLPDDLIDVILRAYFGDVDGTHAQRLKDMVFVVQLHVVAWGLTHHVLGTPAQGWEGFTFLGFATDLLDHLVRGTSGLTNA